MPRKTALVTGAAGNLGKSVTAQLLSDDYTVIGTTRTSSEWANQVDHPNFEHYTVDVTQVEKVQQLITDIQKTTQQIDLAVLLVGGFSMDSLDSVTLEEMQKMYQLNFVTAFVCSQALYKLMKDQTTGGHIIMVGARPALELSAAAHSVSYALSKSLIYGLAEIINAQSSETGVRCTVITPSIIDTPPNRGAMPEANFSDWVTPEEIAKTISFLGSEASASWRQTVVKLYGDA